MQLGLRLVQGDSMGQNTPREYKCGHVGCFKIGKWLPLITVNLIGQTDQEEPVRCAIPMFLCDAHKAIFEPQSALTWDGRLSLGLKTVIKRRKKLNWDTLRVEWRTEGDAQRNILGPDGKPLQ